MRMFDAEEYGCNDMFTPDLIVTLRAAATSDALSFKHHWNVHLGPCLRVW